MRYNGETVEVYHVWPLDRNGGAARSEERIRATNFRDLLRILSEMSAVSRLPDDLEHRIKFVNRRTGETAEQEVVRHFYGSNSIELKGQVTLYQRLTGGTDDFVESYPDAQHAYEALEAHSGVWRKAEFIAAVTHGVGKVQSYPVTWSPKGEPTMWMLDDVGLKRAIPKFGFPVLAEDKRLAALTQLKAALDELSSM